MFVSACIPTNGIRGFLFLHTLSGIFKLDYLGLAIELYECLIYVLDINHLSDTGLMYIFSHSIGYLFTLLIIYFTLQKLFDLMKWRPHLFIFYFVAYAFSVVPKIIIA